MGVVGVNVHYNASVYQLTRESATFLLMKGAELGVLDVLALFPHSL